MREFCNYLLKLCNTSYNSSS